MIIMPPTPIMFTQYALLQTTVNTLQIVAVGTVTIAVLIGAAAVGAGTLGLAVLFAQTGKSGGFYGKKYTNDHAPEHIHLKAYGRH